MRRNLLHATLVTLCGTLCLFTGCGGGEPEDFDNSNPPAKQPTTSNSDLAPTSFGGHTMNGHIGGTSTTFQIATTGGTTGTYNYSENGKYLNSGDYTWVKTDSNTGVLTLSPAQDTMELDYNAPQQGTYVYHAPNYTETGTFTTN